MSQPITAVIVGAGHRSLQYASYSKAHPDRLRIVGLAEPNDLRREQTAKEYNLPADRCFRTAEELAARPKFADAAINGTMDKEHVPTSLPLLAAGYHLLLEKPIGHTREQVMDLLKAARAAKRTVMICHVLRYAPFYVEIRKRIARGDLGEILNIQTAECVSYHHMSVAFVRGKWSRTADCGSSMLLSKCCHDLDLITWLKTGAPPRQVHSLGGLTYFCPEKAPKSAGTRCLVDCPIESECLYSAKKIYLDHPDRWHFYVWSFIEHLENPTLEQKAQSLRTDNPHGRCVWKCDNDVVDHQSVVIRFDDGSTATHNMVGGVSRPGRKIHVIGTKGEIEGLMEDGSFMVWTPDQRPGKETAGERVDLNVSADMHGGGDLRLVEDFIHAIRGEPSSISSTNLEDSIYGHLAVFGADQAMKENKVVELERI